MAPGRAADIATGRSAEALPPAAGRWKARCWSADTPLPTRVHEANLTRDRDGKAVFQVYRPEGSRFYAQDE